MRSQARVAHRLDNGAEVLEAMTDQAVDIDLGGSATKAMSPRATFRRLRSCGLSPEEAGNLTARLEGLRPIRDGWTVADIERLVFLRWLIDKGLFADDSRPDAASLQPEPAPPTAR